MGLIITFATKTSPSTGVTFIMSPSNALRDGVPENLDSRRYFPASASTAGRYKGLTIHHVSNTVGDKVIAPAPGYILFADDGGVTIDVSTRSVVADGFSAPASRPMRRPSGVHVPDNTVGLARGTVYQLETRDRTPSIT